MIVRNLYNSDEAIIRGIKQGDDRALNALYELCRLSIINYVKKNKGNHDEASDILQDAIIVLVTKIKEAEFILHENTQLKTFTMAVAKNIWYKELRRKSHSPPSKDDSNELPRMSKFVPLSDDYDTYVLETNDEEERNEAIKKVLHLMNQLDQNCQDLIYMRFWGGKKLESIAEIIRKKLSAVKMKSKRCLDELFNQYHYNQL